MNEYILKLNNQAHNWENASPIGAGSLGAMVYGVVASERLSVNEETIWNGGEMNTYVPGYMDKMRKIREMFLNGKYVEAEKWANEELKNDFFGIKSFESAGDLYIDIHRDCEVESYERKLDVMRGILSVDYEKYGKKYSREYFASHPARLICMKTDLDPSVQTQIKIKRRCLISTEISFDDNAAILDYIGTTANGEHKFRETLKIVIKDGAFDKTYRDVIVIKGATYAEVYVSVVTEFRDAEMNTEVHIAETKKGYDALKAEHIADFNGIMSRSDITFGDDLVEDLSIGRRIKRLELDKDATDRELISLYYQFGKYLLVSSSREDTYAANLQGLWSDGMASPWNSDYHTNINLQMNYWPAEVANISETAVGLANYLNDCVLEGGRKCAKENYEANGMVLHHVADIYNFAAAADGIWGLWPVGGAWMAYHLWEHYLFTKDEDFLRNVAYEFIRDNAIFQLDTLFEGPDGKLHTGPSTSPENSYLIENDGVKERVFLAISPTMDIQIVGGLLDFYAKCEDILGIAPENAVRAREALAKLPEMKIGQHGQLCEWLEDFEEFEPGHRHISHAFGLYPGAQITRHTPELYEGMKKTIERRLANGGGHTGWSRAWLINQLARIRDGEGAYKNLRSLFTKSTLYNLLDNHPPFQIDGNFGGCAAIAEMVMQSHEGFISLLPAISDELKNGAFRGLRARGNYTVDAAWSDKKITSLKVCGDGMATVELPDGQTDAIFVCSDGVEITAVGSMLNVPCNKEYKLKYAESDTNMKLAKEFHDGMILPKNTPFKVYGEAENAITVSIDYNSAVCWPEPGEPAFEVTLPAHEEGGPFTMFIECNGIVTKIKDVYFGDAE